MTEASTSRLKSCKGCGKEARYTCPACAFPSCSLPCSKQHKVDLDCSGIAPPIWSLELQANELGWGPLMRDQSYISGVGRKAEEIGKQLVGEKLIPQGRRVDETAGRLDDKTEREEKLVRDAREEGVELVLLPKGMSRRVRNGSRFDQKASRFEWTTEVIFQPYPFIKPSPAPLTFTTVPQPSTSTLYSVLNTAMALRDKKGKGKEVNAEESKWAEAEKKWLRAFRPDEEDVVACKESTEAQQGADTDEKMEGSSTTASHPPGEELSDAEDEEAEPPFLLLLSVFTPPPPPPRQTRDGEEDEGNPNLVTPTAPGPSPSSSNKPPARKYYLVHPSLTLRLALANTTQLEYPSFELWSREAFLRARLMGKLEIIDKPRELKRAALDSGSWERGRGRGRGRGAGRGGRGGRGGGQGGRERGPRMEEQPVERVSDSGWGKRAAALTSAEVQESREEKRPRVEQELTSAPVPPPAVASAPLAGLGTGLSGLVGYDSD